MMGRFGKVSFSKNGDLRKDLYNADEEGGRELWRDLV